MRSKVRDVWGLVSEQEAEASIGGTGEAVANAGAAGAAEKAQSEAPAEGVASE